MKYSALLIDMDGVLVDTEPVHEESRRLTYQKYGINYCDVSDIPVIGRNTDAIFAEINSRVPFPVDLKTAIKTKRDFFVSLLGSSVEPLPGIVSLIDFAKANKLSVALVTASAGQNVMAVLKSTKLAEKFDALVVAEDVTKWKPDPEGYLLAAKRVETPPEKCLVIEDSPVGVAAGKAANMKVIGVMTGQGGKTPKNADLLVENIEKGFSEIVKMIRGE